MASSSFSIDLDEVETAATMIQRMYDDLEEAYIKLSTYVGTVKDDVYGSDLVGKSLGGNTASVIGLAEQQKKTLEGIKAFMENTAQVAANLKTMCGGHRSTDTEHSDALRQIGDGLGDGAGELPPPPLPPAPGSGPGYVSQSSATLDYNHAQARHAEAESTARSGGGSHARLE
ncbi:hypothetical protein [Kitasatospora camelliae]|uniref:Excreted virulence factor EspC (Type VII ESX diderm) n=1 Tax=Kitasatospora camelliae TaxID=3156397 RepID=A0AAU8JPI0_9ACTN